MEAKTNLLLNLPKTGEVSEKFIGTKSTRFHHPRTQSEWVNRFLSRFSTKKPRLDAKGKIIPEPSQGEPPNIWSH